MNEAQRRASAFNLQARVSELEADIIRLRALVSELLVVLDHTHDPPVTGCETCALILRARAELRRVASRGAL